MSEIVPNVFLSDMHRTCDVKKLGVTVVVSVGLEFNGYHQIIKYYPDILYYCVPVMDEPSVRIDRYFTETLKIINHAVHNNKRVLIHCAQGRSRSVTMYAAWLMKYCDMTTADALSKIKHHHKIAEPNQGFIEQLILFEKKEPADARHPYKISF
jgi:dual specificity phosphatase 12